MANCYRLTAAPKAEAEQVSDYPSLQLTVRTCNQPQVALFAFGSASPLPRKADARTSSGEGRKTFIWDQKRRRNLEKGTPHRVPTKMNPGEMGMGIEKGHAMACPYEINIRGLGA